MGPSTLSNNQTTVCRTILLEIPVSKADSANKQQQVLDMDQSCSYACNVYTNTTIVFKQHSPMEKSVASEEERD